MSDVCSLCGKTKTLGWYMEQCPLPNAAYAECPFVQSFRAGYLERLVKQELATQALSWLGG